MKVLDICVGEELPNYQRGDNLELLLHEFDMDVMYAYKKTPPNITRLQEGEAPIKKEVIFTYLIPPP